jgi:hypothetical protein
MQFRIWLSHYYNDDGASSGRRNRRIAYFYQWGTRDLIGVINIGNVRGINI